MKTALVNPPWSFEGSVYFGCQDPHLPLELGYARALLHQAGHEAEIIDAHLERLSLPQLRRRVEKLDPELILITTAPTYLFWRCAQPELRVPMAVARELRPLHRTMVAAGPHPSATPGAALNKLPVDAVIRGEFEEALVELANGQSQVEGLVYRGENSFETRGGPREAKVGDLPALEWPERLLRQHRHHHHRFDPKAAGLGAEVEAARGCPFHCSFCAREFFRGRFRKRPIATVMNEIDGLRSQGVGYIYFIDETFMPDQRLIEQLARRDLKFGVQTRIDLWTPELIEALGRAGCVSIGIGIESVTEEGRARLNKSTEIRFDEMTQLLAWAREFIPFVQANLLQTGNDDPKLLADWRRRLVDLGVRVNNPVPLFPYPGSTEFTRQVGKIDDLAWERAHSWYLLHAGDADPRRQPLALPQLERLEVNARPKVLPARVLMTADAQSGIWNYALGLSAGLCRSGNEVMLAVMGGSLKPWQRQSAAAVPGLTLRENNFKLEWMDQPEDDLEKAGRWLLDLEEEFAPDVIHLNDYAHAGLTWRAPTVVVTHSCVLSWWKAVKKEPAPTSYEEYAQRVSDGLRAADLVVAPTRAQMRVMEKIYGPLPRARVIHHSRSSEMFPPLPKEHLILSVGRVWDEAKNIGSLASVARMLNWPVVVAGDWQGPDGSGKRPEGVRCLGLLPPAELAVWYGRASLFVLPARYEPFGLAALEAALAGCALVLGDIETLHELWDGAAVFVHPDSPEELAVALDQITRDPSLIDFYGRAARRRAMQYTPERMLQSYLEVYQSLYQPDSSLAVPVMSEGIEVTL